MEDAFAIASPAIHVTRDQSGILHGQYLSSSAAESSRLGGGVPWGDITDADTLRAPDRKGWGRLARSNSEPLNLKAVVDRRAERMLPLTEEVVVTNKRKQTSTKEQAEKKLRKEEGETSSF
jgi:hypothetical protein